MIINMRFCFLLILVAIACCALASAFERFRVGDEEGWKDPGANHNDMYNLWAGKTRFRVGDSIYFQYKNDSVLMVDKRGYYHCNTTDPIAYHDDGETVVLLESPGLLYFVSGDANHCKNGQRLIVDVIAAHPPEQPPYVPPPLSPPSGSAISAPSPTPLPSAAGTLTSVTSVYVFAAITVVALVIPISA